MRFNKKHGILFKVSPPVAWTKFVGLMYIDFEYHNNSTDYDKEYHNVEFIYNGNNYNSLLKFLKMT